MTRVCLPRKPHDKLGIMPCPTTPTTCRTTSATKRRRTFWKIEKTTKNTTEIKWLPDNDGGGSEAFYVGVFRASYFNQRYYDPELGRFLSNDPKHQSMNPYMYCSNSPLMYVDPDGEFWWLIPTIFNWAASAMIAALPAAIESALWTGATAAAGNVAWQVGNNLVQGKGFGSVDWQSVGNSFGSGALMGGIGSLTAGFMPQFGGDWLGKAMSQGVNTGINSMVYSSIMGENMSWDNAWNKFGSGFGLGFGSSVARSIYENQVGWEADQRPGDGILKEKPEGISSKQGYNAWGNPSYKDNGLWDVFPGKEGGPMSIIANLIPGQNAFAHLHDKWSRNGLMAILLAVPAQYVTYTALSTRANR